MSFAREIRLVLLVSMLTGAADAAGVDITNRWVLDIAPSSFVRCVVQIQQSGTSLEIHGGCANAGLNFVGTIDPTTGEFTADGDIVVVNPPSSAPCTFAGTASPSGTQLSGTISDGNQVLNVTGGLCRNGNLDPGEACDTGFDGGRCCTSACTVEPDGTTCTTGSGCQVDEACASGVCAGTPLPAGSSCDTDRDLCTEDTCDGGGGCVARPCSPCCRETGGQCFLDATCTRPTEASSTFALTTAPSTQRGRLAWRLTGLPDTDASEFGDPTAGTDVALCPFYYDELHGPTLLAAFRARGGTTCGSRACWKSRRNGFRYRDRRSDSDGLTSVLLKAGSGGGARIIIKGRGATLPEWPGLPHMPLGVLLRAGTRCWGADYVFDVQDQPGAITAAGGQ